MSRFRYTVGPWNVAEGTDVYGPQTRRSLTMKEKIERFAQMGFSAIQFHDDDAVPDIQSKSIDQIRDEAHELREFLDSLGVGCEFVAPRLWFDPAFKDGAYTAPKRENWERALWRSERTIDIANILGADLIVLWLAREGTLCQESKNPVDMINQLKESLNYMLGYDDKVRIAIEPKPNEPIDRSYAGTAGHALALGGLTDDPSRCGVLIESAHSVLAGLDPTADMAFAIAANKLFSVHLNDQNGMKFDQDKIFGSESLRSTFNQIKLLIDNNYGSAGEYIGLDVKAMRSTADEFGFKHLENSLRIVELMEDKVEKFDQSIVDDLVAKDDYEGVEIYILELLLGA
ncbi:TIM barrel protein [Schaalia sp. ZJ405]|uniref:TIM barrel protein n=1 Tax=unclassified Schaalia TaxID=2691889 RepID=UPI0013EAF9C8|nr:MULTISPECIES: TIM barrel protein [unclassified Schaalia]QPK81285.1 TIM barrel protein [Schaalia sp. ZJ405]